MQLGSLVTDCIPSLLDVPDGWLIRLIDLLLKGTDDLPKGWCTVSPIGGLAQVAILELWL